MADESADGDLERSGQGWADEDTFYAMESLQATLQHLEAALRQRDVSEASSTEYCDNFCEALAHYAGSRNSVEHGLTLLEVYCLSINCFASARPHLTASSSSVALVLKRLALSCFELLLSVPQNEIPLEAWLQFHGSVQAAHEAMLEYGSTDLQALVQITGEGGAWSNPSLISLLTEQPTEEDELNAYLGLEGGDFLEMRIKHLEKVGEVEKAVILTKACANCSLLPNQATFRQNYVTQLCQQLPSEEAILEISRLDGKDVLDIICNMESEGGENTAIILCTTYLTQQLHKGSLYCSWELTLFWSKLQRRLDGSFESFLERCLQFGAIAKTVYHLLYLIRVIQTEVMHHGLSVSVELCVKALQLPRQEYPETKTSVCKTVACLLLDDLEVLRTCQLTEFFLSPSLEVFVGLEDLYKRPDQKYDEANAIIPNSLRCELLLALKAHWPCDPEFWDWKTLKHYCMKLLGLESDEEDDPVLEHTHGVSTGVNGEEEHRVEEEKHEDEKCSSSEEKNEQHKEDEGMSLRKSSKMLLWTSERSKRWLQYKVRCEMCQKEVIESRLCHHARKHVENGVWTCPVCLQKCANKDEFVPHSKTHLQMPAYMKRKKVKNKMKHEPKLETGEYDLEPGEIRLDTPSGVLEHVMEPSTIVPNMEADDEYITFDYISTHYKLQDREVYVCPATDCSKHFKLFKYLGVHLKNDHDDADPNVRHYFEMSNRREKCTFCRRTFITAYHNQMHRRTHYGDCPYMCVVAGCNSRFESINKLVMHKHKHSFRLSYHCELKGCSLSFCDLGQLYHHEAQHFRDAAFTCTSPGCKKFYYSRQEFLKHTSTHGITFTEKDFEAQRKARRKLLLPVIKEEDCSKVYLGSEEECLNGEQTNPSSPQHSESKDTKCSVTCVAICFDGKKFTCGFEKCGRTFSKAREIQKHLKIVHPSQIKKGNIVCKTMENEKHSKAKPVKEHNGQDKGPTKGSGKEQATDCATCDETSSALSSPTCHTELAGALAEIVLGLNQLSLNSTTPRKINSSHTSGSKVLQVTCPKTVNSISQTKVTASKTELASPQAAADLARQQSRSQPPQKAESPLSLVKNPSFNGNKSENNLHISKPFICEVEGCFYKSVTSHALMQHYIKKHDYNDEKVKRMDIFNPLKFKPFKCHICSRDYKEKKELKAHLLQKHNLSKEVAEQIMCSFARKVEYSLPSALKTLEVQTDKDNVSTGNNCLLNGDLCVWKGTAETNNGAVMSEHKSLMGNVTSEAKPDVDDASMSRRVSKRLMTKVKPDEDKPYLCLHKGCGASFTKKFNLLRHLQVVHYHRSNLCWQKTFPCKHDGCNKRFNHLSSLNRHYHQGHPVSEDPIPRFKCTFPNCNATYHLKSSLIRHTNQMHQNQISRNSTTPSSICKFKDVYRHCDNSDPLVVRLQSTHKREGSDSGCQKKLIITPSSQSLKVSKNIPSRCSPEAEENGEHAEETPEEEPDVKCVKPKTIKAGFAYRTPEEALQMCQDRCLSEAYPCMVQSCNSVVSSKRSLHRHYLKCHKMLQTKLSKNKDMFFYTAEQLEELIQKKSAVSALPDSDSAPNGVLKMEYQAENSGAPHHPMSLHSIKTEQMKQEASPSRDPPPDCSIIIGADDVLYGESNGHVEKLGDTENQTQVERTKNESPAPPLVPPPPLDLSPPSTLRINNASLDPLNRESKAVSVPATIYIHTNASLTRQPLRGKNSELSEPLPSAPHPLSQKDGMVPNLGQRPFDMAAYKPLGFESSFLKFIQEKEENSQFDPLRTVAVLNPCYKADAARRHGTFRHNYSVKENNLRRSSITHTRMSHLSPLKSLLSTEECSSIQNLRFILERALMGCGDQAIKQLQFLKPVVVLERPKSSAPLLDLLPSETQA